MTDLRSVCAAWVLWLLLGGTAAAVCPEIRREGDRVAFSFDGGRRIVQVVREASDITAAMTKGDAKFEPGVARFVGPVLIEEHGQKYEYDKDIRGLAFAPGTTLNLEMRGTSAAGPDTASVEMKVVGRGEFFVRDCSYAILEIRRTTTWRKLINGTFVTNYWYAPSLGHFMRVMRQGEFSQVSDIASIEDWTSPPPTRKILGLRIGGKSDVLAKQYNIVPVLGLVDGVVVLDVEADSDAAKKKLSPGDTITHVTDERVADIDQFAARVDALRKQGKKHALLLVATPTGELRYVPLSLL